jgi:hypothetical protein
MLYPMRVLWSKLAIAVLVGTLAIGGLTPVSAAGDASPNTPVGSQSAAPNASTNWNFQMVFSTGTYTYLLQPLKVTHGTVSGTVLPPNTSCPGVLSGTLKRTKLSVVITYPGTPCAVNSVNLTGFLYMTTGLAAGTFTATYDCTGTCMWSGNKT